MVHCPGGNATDPIWRVLASSDGISSWTPLKPQHCNPNLNPFTNQSILVYWLPYSSHTSHRPSLSPCLPWISYATQNWCSIHARWSKSSLKHCIHFCGIFRSLKQNFIYIVLPHIQIAFLKFTSCVYSNCCCSCSFEPEIIKIGQSSHKMFCNNILNFQVYTTILNACTKKKSGNLLNSHRTWVVIRNSIHYFERFA